MVYFCGADGSLHRAVDGKTELVAEDGTAVGIDDGGEVAYLIGGFLYSSRLDAHEILASFSFGRILFNRDLSTAAIATLSNVTSSYSAKTPAMRQELASYSRYGNNHGSTFHGTEATSCTVAGVAVPAYTTYEASSLDEAQEFRFYYQAYDSGLYVSENIYDISSFENAIMYGYARETEGEFPDVPILYCFGGDAIDQRMDSFRSVCVSRDSELVLYLKNGNLSIYDTVKKETRSVAADIKAYAFDPDKKLVYCLDNEKQLDLFDPQDGGTLHIASDVEKIGIAETGNLFYLAAGELYMLDAGRETTLVSEDAGFLVVDGPAVYYGKCLGDGFFDLYSSFDGADFQLCVSGLAMDGGQYTDPRELVSALVEAASSGDKESVLAHDRFEEHQIQRLRHIGTDI